MEKNIPPGALYEQGSSAPQNPAAQEADSAALQVALRAANKALQVSEERHRSLVEIMPAGVYTCDSQGLITYYNPRAVEVWGRAPKQNDPADRFCGFLHVYNDRGAFLPQDEEPVTKAVRTGQEMRYGEARVERYDGSTIIISLSIGILYDPQGNVTGAINVFDDISHRKQAEEALRHAHNELEQRVAERTAQLELRNQELDQFAYIASHDLKSPLRAIESLASWIVDDCGDTLPPTGQKHLEKLRQRVQRMERLLDDLLTYYRVDREDSIPVTVHTTDLAQGIVDILALPPGLRVTVDKTMPTLIAERVPLELILRNLLDNAIKHHHQPQKGHIRVSAQTAAHNDRYIQFTVADNGPGIDARFHERIFQVFQTLRPRDEVEGSGMGLAVVKKLVESRGGNVWVESVPGKGTIFRFTWPKQTIAPQLSALERTVLQTT